MSAPGLGDLDLEVVERKGVGHPDSVADALAESLSVAYSRYTLEHFGAILHHNFDKVSVLGGKTEVDFGDGRLTSPIRIILNGRASVRFGDEIIPVPEILEEETRNLFSSLFGDHLNPSTDLALHWFLSSASGPGKLKHSTGSRGNLFTPRSIVEVKGYDRLLNNDTSIGSGYAPLSPLERAVLELEKDLNSETAKVNWPWLGTDIKIMAVRTYGRCDFTLCLPQIAQSVSSLGSYQVNLETIRGWIQQKLASLLPDFETFISLNTRDNFDRGDVYLTAIGSSIEAGDEGIVGRGNRVNGLITPCRPMNLEGACGKNPKYYTGKLYNVAAHKIASRLYEETGCPAEVHLVSQAGQLIVQPWKAVIRISGNQVDRELITRIVEEELELIPGITDALLERKIRLF